jgi:23S rRNA pseudouridine1911/1915/1917 synthase
MPRTKSIWTWRAPATLISRADRALIEALESGQGTWEGNPSPCSRSYLQKLIENNQVTCNEVPLKANAKLRQGDLIRIDFPPPQSIDLSPEDRPLEILFEDEHLAVINKPQGLTVHPSTTQTEGTLVHALLHHIKDLSGIGGKLRPGIVHRIDKDTSGVMVITKTDRAHQALTEVFSRHAIERAYWALCYGNPIPEKQKIESLIGRNPTDRKKMSMKVKEGRKAITWIKTIEKYSLPKAKPFASWVEARLETGRTHQVRVHLTGIGASLLGDPIYGVPTSRHPKWLALPPNVQSKVEGLPGQALHARILGFEHPVTKQPLRFEADPPAAFRLLLEELQKYR